MTAQSLPSPPLTRWQPATWADYVHSRTALPAEQYRLFFYQNSLLTTEMGWEGIAHATICDLFTLILGLWFIARPEQQASSLGRCLLEQNETAAGAPDLVLYLGADYPRWQPGESRRIDLNRWRAPDLVGEVSDTTLVSDLDEKKQLYAALGIAEYWVIDVRGQRAFIFLLDFEGKYCQSRDSQALNGLSAAVLEGAIAQLATGSNISAAQWFVQQTQPR